MANSITAPPSGVREKEPGKLIEIGSSGLDIIGGQIREEFLAELTGSRGMAVYREMSQNSSVIGAILFAIRNLIRQVEWSISPASAAAEDEAAADFLRTCKDDMSHTWGEFIDEILSMLVYGFAIIEPVYKRREGDAQYDASGIETSPDSAYDDGLIGWRKMAQRSQASVWEWDVSRSSEVMGLWQLPPPTYDRVYIPASRFLHFRPQGYKHNPEGMSVLRNAYRSWYFAKHIENLEGIGLERDLVGIPVAYVPPQLFSATATSEQRQMLESFKSLVRNLHQNEQAGAVLPMSYDETGKELYRLELLSVSSRRLFDTGAVIQRYDQRIAQTVLADFVLLGHEAVGSYALADSKTSLFSTAIGTWLDSITDVLNRHAVPRLFKLNPQLRTAQGLPQFTHGDIETPDLAGLSAYITALAGAGFPLFPTPTGELEEHLLRAAKLPVPANGMIDLPEGESLDSEDEVPRVTEDGDAPAIDSANVAAILDIVTRVNASQISRESALAILEMAYAMTPDQARAILGQQSVGQSPPPPSEPPNGEAA